MRLSILFFLLLISRSSYAQELLTEIAAQGKIDNISGMTIEEDVFITMDVVNPNGKKSSKSYLIQKDGSKSEVDLTAILGKYLIGGVREGENTYFYYIYEKSDRVLIEAMRIDNKTGKGVVLSNSMDVPGKIYGSYVENGSLFMLCGIKKEFTLRLLQFQSGTLIKQTNFPLSINLAKKKEGIVSFFDTGYPVSPKQAAAVIKIVKEGKVIWITFDEPMPDYDYTATEATVFKTTAIRLDLETEKVEIKAFFESQRHPFTSSMFNGNLYRLVIESRSMRIDQFNFTTGKLVKSTPLDRGTEPGRDSTYAHISGRFKTEKDVKGAAIIKRVFGYLLIVDSLSSTEKFLTVGHYGDHIIAVIGPASVAGLIVTAASLIVREVAEGPISTVYSYYRGSMDKGFTATYKSPFVRKVMDDYEYRQLISGVRYDYRGYLDIPGATCAIYQKDKSKTIQILKFENK